MDLRASFRDPQTLALEGLRLLDRELTRKGLWVELKDGTQEQGGAHCPGPWTRCSWSWHRAQSSSRIALE